MKIEAVDPKTLLEDEANVRAHNERNLRAIRESLARFGQQKPIVVDRQGRIVAGHGLATTAVALGMPSVLIVRTDLEGDARDAYAIADNRAGDLAEWKAEDLEAALAALRADDPALLAAAGFTATEARAIAPSGQFAPSEESDQGRLDTLTPHVCRECGHAWIP